MGKRRNKSKQIKGNNVKGRSETMGGGRVRILKGKAGAVN